MCGRIIQIEDEDEYAEAMEFKLEQTIVPEKYRKSFNAAPHTLRIVFRLVAGKLVAEALPWRYLSHWAKERNLRPAINARRDKLLTPYYRSMMKNGRVIVPADGWYEWTGPKGDRQPWLIQAKDKKPLFFAALTNQGEDMAINDDTGLLIVTDDSAGGMVDVHDRRPVALTAEDAMTWLDTSFSYKQAEELIRSAALGPEYFQWSEVSKDVGGHAHDGPELLEPTGQIVPGEVATES